MKFNYLSIALSLSLLFFACGSATTKKETSTTSSSITSTSPSTSTSSSYETVVLKSGIPSPKKEMKGMIGDKKINIIYGSPSVKGRQVLGGLVPYDKVWRTGANEATSIEFSKDVQIEGKPLPAGKYGLFTIPSADKWTIVFNKVYDQWGAYEYDKSKDALRVDVKSTTETSNTEAMAFALEDSNVILRWEKLAVPFQVK